MIRIFDTEKNYFVSPVKLPYKLYFNDIGELVVPSRYVVTSSIGALDAKGALLFEQDIVRWKKVHFEWDDDLQEDIRTITVYYGIISHDPKNACYYFNGQYDFEGKEVSFHETERVGNTFESHDFVRLSQISDDMLKKLGGYYEK